MLRKRQVFVNVSPGLTSVPSGTVISATNAARLQGTAPTIGVGVFVRPGVGVSVLVGRIVAVTVSVEVVLGAVVAVSVSVALSMDCCSEGAVEADMGGGTIAGLQATAINMINSKPMIGFLVFMVVPYLNDWELLRKR